MTERCTGKISLLYSDFGICRAHDDTVARVYLDPFLNPETKSKYYTPPVCLCVSVRVRDSGGEENTASKRCPTREILRRPSMPTRILVVEPLTAIMKSSDGVDKGGPNGQIYRFGSDESNVSPPGNIC